jgi:ubiquinone/menaquinone biosynthesis C-methylase UbiE
MSKKNSRFLFNTIAPVYGLFYRYQKKRFLKVVRGIRHELDVTTYETVLDVGCGTGALCSVLRASGLTVTGIDPAEKMLGVARRQPENTSIPFIRADVLDRLPFDDKSFDISIASYVAHGLQKRDRKQMYSEMRRVTKSKVIIYDYNQNRGLLTSVIEWLERGDYFRFIKNAQNEMRNCVTEMQECFSDVKAVDVDTRAAWYICTPR